MAELLHDLCSLEGRHLRSPLSSTQASLPNTLKVRFGRFNRNSCISSCSSSSDWVLERGGCLCHAGAHNVWWDWDSYTFGWGYRSSDACPPLPRWCPTQCECFVSIWFENTDSLQEESAEDSTDLQRERSLIERKIHEVKLWKSVSNNNVHSNNKETAQDHTKTLEDEMDAACTWVNLNFLDREGRLDTIPKKNSRNFEMRIITETRLAASKTAIWQSSTVH